MSAYENHAVEWNKLRTTHFPEQLWVERCLAGLRPGAHILDVGCGTGNPIAAHLLSREFAVTGVDFAASMIAIAQTQFPTAKWILADMTTFETDDVFDAVISWDGFFHLTPGEQRTCLKCLCEQINRDHGRLMVTIGHDADETTGTVFGDEVYHASLDHDEYRHLLEGYGFTSTEISSPDLGIGSRTVLFGKR